LYHNPSFYPYRQTYQPYRGNQLFTMTVDGNGHSVARPNQAKLTLGVMTEHPSVQAAQQENAEISNRVIEGLKQMGIDESDLKTTLYSVQPRYDFHDGKSILRGYEVEHLFEVTIKDLSKIGNVYDIAIKNGANRSGDIQFQVTDAAIYYQEALIRAIQNAREKAEVMANSIGATLSNIPIKIIEQEDQRNLRPVLTTQSAFVKAEAVPPIQTGDLTIKAQIKIIYAYSG
jgi:uncharacterized protein